jgi:hypothetical protein
LLLVITHQKYTDTIIKMQARLVQKRKGGMIEMPPCIALNDEKCRYTAA